MPVRPKDKIQENSADVWWFDEATSMPNYDSYDLEKQLLREIISQTGYTRRPAYQTRPAFHAPDFFIVQYIGGAFNGTQEYLNYATHKLCVVEGGVYDKALPSPPPTISPEGVVSAAEILHARYSLTFIPRDQTPFAESSQVVIALFKE